MKGGQHYNRNQSRYLQVFAGVITAGSQHRKAITGIRQLLTVPVSRMHKGLQHLVYYL